MTRSNMENRESVKHRHRLLESCVTRKCHAQFGGGQTEKERQRHLVGWLPYFSNHSHGFRPHRGCHTALTAIKQRWSGTRWFIEGDISQCFDKLDHDVLMATLREHLHDNRFLRLVETMLAAGYLEDWRWNATYSGAPQGGVLSPVLSNIYLDRLDTFIERRLLPCYNRGKKRAADATYQKVTYALAVCRREHIFQEIVHWETVLKPRNGLQTRFCPPAV